MRCDPLQEIALLYEANCGVLKTMGGINAFINKANTGDDIDDLLAKAEKQPEGTYYFYYQRCMRNEDTRKMARILLEGFPLELCGTFHAYMWAGDEELGRNVLETKQPETYRDWMYRAQLLQRFDRQEERIKSLKIAKIICDCGDVDNDRVVDELEELGINQYDFQSKMDHRICEHAGFINASEISREMIFEKDFYEPIIFYEESEDKGVDVYSLYVAPKVGSLGGYEVAQVRLSCDTKTVIRKAYSEMGGDHGFPFFREKMNIHADLKDKRSVIFIIRPANSDCSKSDINRVVK